MKIIKYLLLIFFIISFIIFLLPFLLKGILNIGNIAGMIVSLGCFLIIFFNKPLHHLIFSKIILSFIIILLAIISTCSYKILTNMNILPQEETTVVVLGCRVKNKKPSLALKERLDKTYQYLNENPKLQCILSGGQGANEEISEAKCMYQYLVSKGIDPHRLYQEDKSTSTRENILSRMKEVCHKIADTYRGTVEIEMVSTVPPLMCDPQLTLEMAEYMSQIGIEGLKGIPNSIATASEDFAIIAEKIPTTYMILTAGFMDERGDYPLHHPKAQFDENVCVIGAACFAYCASHWLGNHKNRT